MLFRSAQSQAASVEEITATVDEISAGIDNVAAGASDQVERITRLVETIDRLTGIIHDVERKTSEAARVTGSISDIGPRGRYRCDAHPSRSSSHRNTPTSSGS